jgi:gluconolactonase
VSYEFERLGTDFEFTEGPLWHPTGKFLIFSDIPADHMYRWSAAGGIETFRTPSQKANGNTYDRQGLLLSCHHQTSQVTRTEADGRLVVLATHFKGKTLNSPNDIVCHPDGGIYFTDPPYGRSKAFGAERPQELAFQGVYRVGSNPLSPELLVDDFDRPNGLCFSLDGARLFINDTTRQQIRVFDLGPTGSLGKGRLWAETKGSKPGGPDGMKIDSAGNIYCTGPGGIHVFSPDGELREVIEVPEYTANFAFGDDDYRSLFITASTSLYRIRVTTPGLPVF